MFVLVWLMVGALGAVYAFKSFENHESDQDPNIQEALHSKVASVVILLIFMVIGPVGFVMGLLAYEGSKED